MGSALFTNSDGDSINAIVFFALGFNTTCSLNKAIGVSALLNNDTGNANTAIVHSALSENVNDSYNTVIGFFAGASVDGNDGIYIGATSTNGVTSESSTTRNGDPAVIAGCYIAGVSGRTARGACSVHHDRWQAWHIDLFRRV